MIELEVKTVMKFDNEDMLRAYYTSREVNQITGFAEEIQTAFRTKEPVEVTTPRSEWATRATTTVRVT